MDYRIYIMLALVTLIMFFTGIFNLAKLDRGSRMMLALMTIVLAIIMILASFNIEGMV